MSSSPKIPVIAHDDERPGTRVGPNNQSTFGRGPEYKDQMREMKVSYDDINPHHNVRRDVPGDVRVGPSHKDPPREAGSPVDPYSRKHRNAPDVKRGGPTYKGQMREVGIDCFHVETRDLGSAKVGQQGPSYKDQMREAIIMAVDEQHQDAPNNSYQTPATEIGPPVAIPIGESQIQEEEEEEQLAGAERRVEKAELRRQEALAKLSKRQRTRKRLGCAAVVLLLLGVAVVAGMCGYGKCKSLPDQNPDDTSANVDPPTIIVTTTGSPTKSPTTAPTPLSARARYVLDHINTITLTGRSLTYSDSNTPEGKSLHWLIKDDETWRIDDETLSATSLRQRYALLTLYFQSPANIDNRIFGFWIASRDECSWDYVGCDDSNVVVNLTRPSIQGQISVELGLLTAMTYLDLSNNRLIGTIPSSLAAMSSLTELRLYNNMLNGTMPFCSSVNSQRFEYLVTDCIEVECPCCTHCCSAGGINGIPEIPSDWDIQCRA